MKRKLKAKLRNKLFCKNNYRKKHLTYKSKIEQIFIGIANNPRNYLKIIKNFFFRKMI